VGETRIVTSSTKARQLLLDCSGDFELRTREDFAIFSFNFRGNNPEPIVAGYNLIDYPLGQPVSNHSRDDDSRIHQKRSSSGPVVINFLLDVFVGDLFRAR
jgi:hypothetical protein